MMARCRAHGARHAAFIVHRLNGSPPGTALGGTNLRRTEGLKTGTDLISLVWKSPAIGVRGTDEVWEVNWDDHSSDDHSPAERLESDRLGAVCAGRAGCFDR